MLTTLIFTFPGYVAPVHRPYHHPCHVEVEDRPGQLGHPVPDGVGRPAGIESAGVGVPVPTVHRTLVRRNGGGVRRRRGHHHVLQSGGYRFEQEFRYLLAFVHLKPRFPLRPHFPTSLVFSFPIK